MRMAPPRVDRRGRLRAPPGPHKDATSGGEAVEGLANTPEGQSRDSSAAASTLEPAWRGKGRLPHAPVCGGCGGGGGGDRGNVGVQNGCGA